MTGTNKTTSNELKTATFEDMGLRGGITLQMRQEGTVEVAQYPVRYIGMIAGVSFLTTLPVREDGVIWLRQGSLFSFRALAGTHLYAFDARALRAHTRPSPYAHFTVPDKVHYRAVRRDPRVETRLPAEIERPDGTRSMAIVRDISLRGATLELAGFLADPGDPIRIDLPLILPELSKKMEMRAVVRNGADHLVSVERAWFRYGIEFVEIDEENAILLHYFIDHLIAELHAKF